jgi:putative two-component system response regulator
LSVILTVDDAEVELAVYERLIRAVAWPGGAENVSFLSSADALLWAQSHDVDLAIVDYGMPALDGLELIQRLRGSDRHRETPIIMITAALEHAVRYRALELGASDFLTKPIDRTEFIVRVRNVLASSDIRKKLAARDDELMLREREAIHRLAGAAEFGGRAAGSHVARVGLYCGAVARALSLPLPICELLTLSATMHDVGNVTVPQSILGKPAALNSEEREIVTRHALAGHVLLQSGESELLRLAAEIAISHHERVDGSGYPRRLIGDAIPIAGRICAVSDTFDALTSRRPYRDAGTVDRAVEHLAKHAGTLFDAAVVNAFLAALPEITQIKARHEDEVR